MTELSVAVNIIKQQRFLFEQGFTLVESTDKPKGLGYWLVTLRSEKLTLKFYEDRGQVMLLCGPVSAPLGWRHTQCYDIDVLIGFFHKKEKVTSAPFPIEVDTQVTELIEKLKSYYNPIIELYAMDPSLQERQTELTIYWYKINNIPYKRNIVKKRNNSDGNMSL